jgi:plasmid stabilization system protein ParE
MSWGVVVRPEVEADLSEAAAWYDSKEDGLETRFVEEVLRVFDELATNPLLNSRKHPSKNVRWRYPEHFPYQVIYEVQERQQTVIIAAVLHAARHDRHWRKRV